MIVIKNFKDNFLDTNIKKFVKQVRKKYSLIFKAIFSFNNLSKDIEKHFVKENVKDVDIYVFTIFNKIHNIFQSAVLLTERGLCNDALILLRTMYESIFKMKYAIKEEKNLDIIINDELLKQKGILKKIKKYKLFEYMEEEDIVIKLKEIEEKITDKKQLNTETLSEDVGMNEQYIIYKYLCNYVHNNFSAIIEKVKETEEGIVIESGFDCENICSTLLFLLEGFKDAIKCISNYLEMPEYFLSAEKIMKNLEVTTN